MDAAKGMWLFYEHPEADIEGLKLKFMDIRKRTYKFPKLGEKAKIYLFWNFKPLHINSPFRNSFNIY